MKTDNQSLRRTRTRAGLAAVVLVLLAAGPTRAQTLTTGALSGSVVSASGGSLAEVLLTLEDTSAGTIQTVTAPRSGIFRFAGLAPSAYTLTAERIGFAPHRVVQIEIRPEYELTLRIVLDPTEGAVPIATDRMSPAVLAPAGSGQWIPRFAIGDLIGRTGQLWEVGRFSSLVDDDYETEGLPGWLSSVAVDGMPFRAVGASPAERGVTGAAFATVAFDGARVIANPLDTEWSGAAALVLSAYTLRGSSEARGRVAGHWSGAALSSSSKTDAAYSDVRGVAVLRGAVSGGHFSMGVDARREQLPVSPAWRDTTGTQALVDVDARLDAYRAGTARTTTAVTGFARLDLPVSDLHRVSFSAHAAALPSFDAVGSTGAISDHDGADLVANAEVLSLFGELKNEVRVAVTRSERAVAGDDDDSIPLTSVAHEGLLFGTSPRFDSVREHHVRMSDALHYAIGTHALKLGGSVMVSGYRFGAGLQRGQYSFGDVDQFAATTGVFARTEGGEAEVDWSDRTLAVFAQDRFTVAGRLEVMAGMRVERQSLPVTVERDAEWLNLTGLANDDVDAPGIRLSPRASVVWNAGGSGQWMLSAGGGIFYDRLDPLLLATWQHDDGSLDVRRMVGAVDWPAGDVTDGTLSNRLTLLGSGFEAPRTLRATAGISTRIFAGAMLDVSAVVRRTENLPRRIDLNLVQLPAAHDQYGRQVYGALIKQGGLVAADPGSNRRFTTYDEVAAIVTDRTSEHWGVSAGIERGLAGGLGLLARYTFGRTTDDWFGARDGGWYTAAPAGLDQDSTWSDGTSDLDIPHRFVAGLLWNGPADVRVGAAYRMQSGRPFTPGFRDGVDANADGIPGNDPAFVDDAVDGMDAVIGRWPCLRASTGAFAQRNACRADPVHGFDVNLAMPLLRFGAGVASVHIDVFDILESSQPMPDAALYLVDPAADLTTDPIARTVTLPLIANDNFGEPLTGRQSGRTIRLGISINW